MFSIIVPLYNKVDYVTRALDAVINQTYTEYEIIVVNDGSTDGSEKIVEDKYGSLVRLIHQQNQGVSTARNTGIKNANYKYIAFLDADDIWHKEYLSFVYQTIVSSNNPGIIGTDFIRFKSINEIEDHQHGEEFHRTKPEIQTYSIADFFNQAINHTLIFTSGIVVKKEFFEKNTGFDPPLKFGEDLDVWYRAILFFGKIEFIQHKLVYYSREDLSAATKKDYHLEQTLIPKIIKEEFFPVASIKDKNDLNAFEAFRLKWIYLRLFPNYRLKENQEPIASLIPKLGNRFFVFKWIYFLPFTILNQLFSRKYPYKLWERYLKFGFKNFK